MPGKRSWMAALLLGVLGATGCCSWCRNHCGCCGAAPAVAPANCCPQQACSPQPGCCPVPAGPVQPVPVPPVPAQSFARPPAANGCCQ